MAEPSVENRSIAAPPISSLLLGYGPVLPLLAAAIIAWVGPSPWPVVMLWLAIWWGGALLVFLAGVRRGLGFRPDGSPTRPSLAVMLWLFVLGAGATVMPTALLSLTLLVLGYASVAILDPIAAQRGEAPAHFARLRPPQMAVALIGLVGLMLHSIVAEMPI